MSITSDIQSSNSSNMSVKFVVDSGASEHMTCDRSLFKSLSYYENMEKYVFVGDGRRISVMGIGEIEFEGNTMSNVLYVPNIKVNLFSIARATKKGFCVSFTERECKVMKGDKVCASGYKDGELYVINFARRVVQCAAISLSEWQGRFCHQNVDYVKSVLRNHNVNFIDEDMKCVVKGKAHRLPFAETTNSEKQGNKQKEEQCEANSETVVYLDLNMNESQEGEDGGISVIPNVQEEEDEHGGSNVIASDQEEEVLPIRTRSGRIVRKPGIDDEVREVPEGKEIVSAKWVLRKKITEKNEVKFKGGQGGSYGCWYFKGKKKRVRAS